MTANPENCSNGITSNARNGNGSGKSSNKQLLCHGSSEPDYICQNCQNKVKRVFSPIMFQGSKSSPLRHSW